MIPPVDQADNDVFDPRCGVCRSNAGLERISPGPVIHMGRAWQVEHAYPCSLPGWLVIVLKRHAEALHELTLDESRELGELQWRVARALDHVLGTEKEYSVLFAEAEGFAHLHVHLVPCAPGAPPERRGTGVFAHLSRA